MINQEYKMFRTIFNLVAFTVLLIIFSCDHKKNISIEDFSAWIGKGVSNGGFKMDNYWVWGGSCIIGDDDMFHLFASRWPKTYPFMNGYPFYSEIVHATSNTPEGPYTFQNVALPARGSEYWDGRMTHNPSVVKVGNTYYLYYIGSTYEGNSPNVDSLLNIKQLYRTPAYKNIRIGVAKTTNLNGTWKRNDNPILSPQPNGFDSVVVTNPAPCPTVKGEIFLIYRTFIRGEGQRLGLAKAVHPDSAYIRVLQRPIDTKSVEDPFIWEMNGAFYIIAKDMTGEITGEKHAGVFLRATDLKNWKLNNPPKAYSRKVIWDNGDTTIQGSLERPQLLIQNGVPTHLFAATADGPGGFRNADNTWNMVIDLNKPK